MAFQDNSPSKNQVRWSNVTIYHNGIPYTIKDGYTKDKYVYWKMDAPNEFVTSETLPFNHYEIILINNNGIINMYPLVKLKMNDDLSGVHNIVNAHVLNEEVHLYNDKQEMMSQIETLDKRVRLLTNDRDDLYKIVLDLQIQIDKLKEFVEKP